MRQEFDTTKWVDLRMDPEVREEISILLEGYMTAGILFPEEMRLVDDLLRKIRNMSNEEVAVPLTMVTRAEAIIG